MLIDEKRFKFIALESIKEHLNKDSIDENNAIISFVVDELVRRAKEYYSKPINRNIKSQSQGQRSITYSDTISNPFMITEDLAQLLPCPSLRLM